jgi:hypothetical protein
MNPAWKAIARAQTGVRVFETRDATGKFVVLWDLLSMCPELEAITPMHYYVSMFVANINVC